MAGKSSNFLSNNIEKLVLPLIGIFGLWVLFKMVIFAPVTVEYQGGEYAPGQIDEKIEKQTEMLEANLSLPPKPVEEQAIDTGRYISEFDNPLSSINASYWPEVPEPTSEEIWDGRQYSVPRAPEIDQARADRIRALAYIPTAEIQPGQSYKAADVEPNDLDLVTVEARLEVADLYSEFYDNFAGPLVKPQWRDTELAKPVFAAVQLERSKLGDDGSWSPWQQVPRLKIDGMSSMFTIIEDVNDLPRGGLKVRLLQFSRPSIMSALLQPHSYDIASAEEEWFPPSLHQKYGDVVRTLAAAERRAELEKLKQERERELENARANRETRRTQSSQSSAGGGGGSDYDAMVNSASGGGARKDRPSRPDRLNRREEPKPRREPEKETISDVYNQFEQLSITEDTQFNQDSNSLLFWAMDDTVEPGSVYKYRIRLGVFNPLAGTQKLASGNEDYRDKVIIWSNYADAGTVEVPQRVYFFAKDIQEAANSVRVEICRYALGSWYSKEYRVEPGELIGKKDTPQPQPDVAAGVLIPQIVNFGTDATMVDTVIVADWTGSRNMQPNEHFEMYYSYDGSAIGSVPVSQRYWSSNMLSTYNEIQSSMRQEKQPIRERATQQGPGRGPQGGEDSYDEFIRKLMKQK
jgi:hypothetical protein